MVLCGILSLKQAASAGSFAFSVLFQSLEAVNPHSSELLLDGHLVPPSIESRLSAAAAGHSLLQRPRTTAMASGGMCGRRGRLCISQSPDRNLRGKKIGRGRVLAIDIRSAGLDEHQRIAEAARECAQLHLEEFCVRLNFCMPVPMHFGVWNARTWREFDAG